MDKEITHASIIMDNKNLFLSHFTLLKSAGL